MSCVQVTIIHQIWNKYEALDGIPDGDLPPQLLRDAKGSNLLSFESAAVAPLDGLHPSVAACSRNLLAAIGTELVTNKALQIAQKVDVKVRTYRMSVRARVRAFACIACVYACVRVRARVGVRVKVVPVWRCTATVDGKAFAFTVYGFDQVMPTAHHSVRIRTARPLTESEQAYTVIF
jgi:hypothetical protein